MYEEFQIEKENINVDIPEQESVNEVNSLADLFKEETNKQEVASMSSFYNQEPVTEDDVKSGEVEEKELEYTLDTKTNQELELQVESIQKDAVQESISNSEKLIKEAKANIEKGTALLAEEINKNIDDNKKGKVNANTVKENKFLLWKSVDNNKLSYDEKIQLLEDSMKIEFQDFSYYSNLDEVKSIYGDDIEKMKEDYEDAKRFYSSLNAYGVSDYLKMQEEKKLAEDFLTNLPEDVQSYIDQINTMTDVKDLQKEVNNQLKAKKEWKYNIAKSRYDLLLDIDHTRAVVNPTLITEGFIGEHSTIDIHGQGEIFNLPEYKNVEEAIISYIDGEKVDEVTLAEMEAQGLWFAYSNADKNKSLRERGSVSLKSFNPEEHLDPEYSSISRWDLDRDSMFHRFTKDSLSIEDVPSVIAGSLMGFGSNMWDIVNSYQRTLLAFKYGDDVFKNESYRKSLAKSVGRKSYVVGQTKTAADSPFGWESGFVGLVDAIPQLLAARFIGLGVGGASKALKLPTGLTNKLAAGATLAPLIAYAGKDYYDEAIASGYSAREAASFSTIATGALTAANWSSTWLLDGAGRKRVQNEIKKYLSSKLVSGPIKSAPISKFNIPARIMEKVPGINRIINKGIIKDFSLRNKYTYGFREEGIQEMWETVGEHLTKNVFSAYSGMSDSEGMFSNITDDGYILNFTKEALFAGAIGGLSGAGAAVSQKNLSDFDKGKIKSFSQIVISGKKNETLKVIDDLYKNGSLGQSDIDYHSLLSNEPAVTKDKERSVADMNRKALLNELYMAEAILGPDAVKLANDEKNWKDFDLITKQKESINTIVDVLHKHNMKYIDYSDIINFKEDKDSKADEKLGLEAFNKGRDVALTEDELSQLKDSYKLFNDISTGKAYQDNYIMDFINASGSKTFSSKENRHESLRNLPEDFFVKYLEAVTNSKKIFDTQIDNEIKQLESLKKKKQEMPSKEEIEEQGIQVIYDFVQKSINEDGFLKQETKDAAIKIYDNYFKNHPNKIVKRDDNIRTYAKNVFGESYNQYAEFIEDQIIGKLAADEYVSKKNLEILYNKLNKGLITVDSFVDFKHEYISTGIPIEMYLTDDEIQSYNKFKTTPSVNNIDAEINKLENKKAFGYSYLENIIDVNDLGRVSGTMSDFVLGLIDDVKTNIQINEGEYTETDTLRTDNILSRVSIHKDFLDLTMGSLKNLGDVQRVLSAIQKGEYTEDGIKSIKGNIADMYDRTFYDPNKLDYLKEKVNKKEATVEEQEEYAHLLKAEKALRNPSREFVFEIMGDDFSLDIKEKEYSQLIGNIENLRKAINKGDKKAVLKTGDPMSDFFSKYVKGNDLMQLLNFSERVIKKGTHEFVSDKIVKAKGRLKENRFNWNRYDEPQGFEEFVDLFINGLESDEDKAKAIDLFSKLFYKENVEVFKELVFSGESPMNILSKYLNINQDISIKDNFYDDEFGYPQFYGEFFNLYEDTDFNSLKKALLELESLVYGDTVNAEVLNDVNRLLDSITSYKNFFSNFGSEIIDHSSAIVNDFKGLLSEIDKIKEDGSSQFSVQDKLSLTTFLTSKMQETIEANGKEGMGANYDSELRTATEDILRTLKTFMPEGYSC